MDFLIVIGAMKARDDFERVKILRETRNDSIGLIMLKQLISLGQFLPA